MSDVTIYHNPHCHASQNAIAIADELGVSYDIVLYLKQRPDRATLEAIADRLEDPVADLVRCSRGSASTRRTTQTASP